VKAIVWTKYGPPDVLQLKEVAKPTPKANEVLIKIHATTVTAGDCEMRNLKFPLLVSLPMRLYAGFRRPTRIKILGQELEKLKQSATMSNDSGKVTRFLRRPVLDSEVSTYAGLLSSDGSRSIPDLPPRHG